MRPIVLLNPIAQLGGAERVLLDVLRGIRKWRGDVPIVLVTLADGPLAEHARQLGARTLVAPLPGGAASLGESSGGLLRTLVNLGSAGPQLWSGAACLRSELTKLKPSVVHSFGVKTHLLLHFAKSPETKTVWHVQDFYGERPLTRRPIRIAARKVDETIAISTAVANDFEQLTGRTPVTIRNAVDVERFSAAGPQVVLDELASIEASGDAVVRFGLLATYARWKGQEVFLQALSRVIEKGSTIPLRGYVVGGPIYQTKGQWSQAELRQIVDRLRIAKFVGFIPFQSDTRPIYRALDVVVHASTQPEPFGLVIPEAMSAGKAVIVSAAGGAQDLFQDEITGLGHSPGDVAALARGIERLAQDEGLRQRLGQNAAAHAREQFAMDRFYQEIGDLYATLCGAAPTRRPGNGPELRA